MNLWIKYDMKQSKNLLSILINIQQFLFHEDDIKGWTFYTISDNEQNSFIRKIDDHEKNSRHLSTEKK